MTDLRLGIPPPSYSCGRAIGVPGRETTCGNHGICPSCWQRREDDRKFEERVKALTADELEALRGN